MKLLIDGSVPLQPIHVAMLQAREWDDADRADAELLKAAWPRLR